MKILLLAGEESGLIYANRLRSMMAADEVRGYGDYGFRTSDLAVMGFTAVLRRIFFFMRVKRTMMRAIDEWRPDAVCTVDYPGMNLRLAAYAKSKGIRTIHVVCPQVWAWKAGRIPRIEASLDALCCFFPFEPRLFRKGFAEFVGHPLVEEFAAEAAAKEIAPVRDQVALLPGSRMGEIDRNLPVMLESVRLLEKSRVVIPAANEGALRRIEKIVAGCAGAGGVQIVQGGARDVLRASRCALVASGTATLEAALARCPTVLVYRVGPFLAWLARRVIKGIGHIGLVNIVWEKSGGALEAPMPELLQEDFTPEAASSILNRWLLSDEARSEAALRLDEIVKKLGTGESSFERIAAKVKGSSDLH